MAQVRVDGLHAVHDSQDRSHGTNRAVIVGARIAEVDQQPIAQVLRDVAVMGSKRDGRCFVVRAQHLAEVLGIDPGRQVCRADQVAEKHGQLPSLGVRGGCHGDGTVPSRLPRGERITTVAAEPGVARVQVPTAWARVVDRGATAAASGCIRRILDPTRSSASPARAACGGRPTASPRTSSPVALRRCSTRPQEVEGLRFPFS